MLGNLLGGKSQIKVLLIGRDNITRKFWVDHDARFYDNKYRMDEDAIVITVEPGRFGLGEKSVPTIIFRENSIEPISKKHPGTIPSPDEFGENVSRAANAIAVLRAQKNSSFQAIVLALIIVAIITSAVGCYLAYSNGTKITELNDKLTAHIDTQFTDLKTYMNQDVGPGGTGGITSLNQTGVNQTGMVFDPVTGTYRTVP